MERQACKERAIQPARAGPRISLTGEPQASWKTRKEPRGSPLRTASQCTAGSSWAERESVFLLFPGRLSKIPTPESIPAEIETLFLIPSHADRRR